MQIENEIITERHPFEPFVPEGARLLMMGTFPPGEHRWSMNFYYPNPINDFWRIMGLLFLNDKDALYDREHKCFYESECRALATRIGMAMSDTGLEVRRLRGNASDKYLEIVTPVPLFDLLKRMPNCHTIATTGEKAAQVIAELTNTQPPRMGEVVNSDDGMRIWRMPSTSRAYPMRLERKAEIYARLFQDL